MQCGVGLQSSAASTSRTLPINGCPAIPSAGTRSSRQADFLCPRIPQIEPLANTRSTKESHLCKFVTELRSCSGYRLGLNRSGVALKPRREFIFGHLAGGQTPKSEDAVPLWRSQFHRVELQKGDQHRKGCALVSIYERVIGDNSLGISCRQAGK